MKKKPSTKKLLVIIAILAILSVTLLGIGLYNRAKYFNALAGKPTAVEFVLVADSIEDLKKIRVLSLEDDSALSGKAFSSGDADDRPTEELAVVKKALVGRAADEPAIKLLSGMRSVVISAHSAWETTTECCTWVCDGGLCDWDCNPC